MLMNLHSTFLSPSRSLSHELLYNHLCVLYLLLSVSQNYFKLHEKQAL